MEPMLGVDFAAPTLKLNVLDCPPSGLFTLMVQVPAPLSVAIIWKDPALTDWICDPLSVVPPPPGKPIDTVSPLWNPDPFTVTVWLFGPAVGDAGEIEPMLGVDLAVLTLKLNVLDCPP